jgi:murein DD-endopeptidase MepM/ murein hydrolase activator NlpD
MRIIDNKHNKKENRKYQVVLITNDSKESTRNFQISKVKVIFYITAGVILFSIFLSLIIGFSPVSRFISKRSPEAQRLVIIEEKIRRLYSEMNKLSNYNDKLRYALGDTTVKNTKQLDLSTLLMDKDNNIQSTTFSNFNKTSNYGFSAPAKTLNIPFVTPVSDYIISQGFDDEKNHFGIDFAGKKGETVVAAADGYVVFSNWTIDYGNTIIIMHGGRFLTKYKHNLCNLKQIGSFVRRGEIIALLGNTGQASSNPHLHFEIWKNGIAVNPLKYLLVRK